MTDRSSSDRSFAEPARRSSGNGGNQNEEREFAFTDSVAVESVSVVALDTLIHSQIKKERKIVTKNSHEKRVKLWTPATYRIEVEGHLDESWSDRLAGMRISSLDRADQTAVTTLIGQLRDQAELSGVLNSLYDLLHLSILKVEVVNDE